MKVRLQTFDRRLQKCKEAPQAIDLLNTRHFTIRVGNKNAVADYRPEDEPNRPIVLFTHDEFRKRYLAHRFVDPATKREADIGKIWLHSHDRRNFDGTLVFEPDPDRAGKFNYNHWQGFAIEPKRGDWKLFRHHLWCNVCQRNRHQYRYLLKFLAHMVQRPGHVPGVAPVLRGGKGVGKTMVYEVVALMFKPFNTILLDNPDDLTGKFNSHLAGRLWVCADEAFFAADPRNAGKLQSRITRRTLNLEPKGIDKYTINSYLRLIICSNQKWVVPASMDERRYAVFDVGTDHQQDLDYFDKISEQMCYVDAFGGVHKDVPGRGTQAMLYDLKRMRLDGFKPMRVIRTAGLEEQIDLSRPPIERWWRDCLLSQPWFGTKGGVLKDVVFDHWHDWCRAKGVHHPDDNILVGKYLNHLYKEFRINGRRRRPDGETAKKKRYVYLFPGLRTARRTFDPRWDEKYGVEELREVDA